MPDQPGEGRSDDPPTLVSVVTFAKKRFQAFIASDKYPRFQGNFCGARFFTVCLLFQVVDFADAALERQALGTDWVRLHLVSVVAFGIAFIIAIRSSNRTYHGALAIAWLLLCLFWGVGGARQPIVAP